MVRHTSSGPAADRPVRGMKQLRTHPRELRARPKTAWGDHVTPTEVVDLSLSDLVDRHLVLLEAGDSASIHDWRTLHTMLLRDFGDVPLRQHTEDMWVGWLKARRIEKPRPAEKTLAKTVGLAASFYELGVSLRALDYNPIRRIPRQHRPSRRVRNPLKAPQSVLTIAEERVVLGDAGFRGDFFDHLFFSAGFCLGGRFGELCGATWADYDASRRPLGGISIEKQWHTKSRTLRGTKDGHPKALPVHLRFAALLDMAPSRYLARVGRLPQPTDPLFPFFPRNGDPSPRRWNQRTALRRWREFLADLGIPDPPAGPRDLHSLRHTFVSRLHAAQVHPMVVRALTHPGSLESAGLGDAHMTYVHLDWSALCEGIAALDFDATPIELTGRQLAFDWEECR